MARAQNAGSEQSRPHPEKLKREDRRREGEEHMDEVSSHPAQVSEPPQPQDGYGKKHADHIPSRRRMQPLPGPLHGYSHFRSHRSGF